MINMPSILLINCVGSYLYSIMEHLSKEDDVNGTLYYFSQGYLKFHQLLMNEVQAKYKDNSWGYQPIKIIDQNENNLEIDASFFDFLINHYNIKIEKLDAEENELFNLFTSVNNEFSFLICTVDELYLKNSVFFQKKHNKHFLLIKSMDYANKTAEIVDSEKNRMYTMQFEEIERAVMKSTYKRKIIYRIDGEKYKNDLVDQMKSCTMIKVSCDYLFHLINDIENKKKDKNFKFEYYYKGYYYNVISKIIPYYYMCEKIYRTDSKTNDFFKMIVLEWINLKKYMLLKMYQNNIDAEALIGRLRKIESKFIEFNSFKVFQ